MCIVRSIQLEGWWLSGTVLINEVVRHVQMLSTVMANHFLTLCRWCQVAVVIARFFLVRPSSSRRCEATIVITSQTNQKRKGDWRSKVHESSSVLCLDPMGLYIMGHWSIYIVGLAKSTNVRHVCGSAGLTALSLVDSGQLTHDSSRYFVSFLIRLQYYTHYPPVLKKGAVTVFFIPQLLLQHSNKMLHLLSPSSSKCLLLPPNFYPSKPVKLTADTFKIKSMANQRSESDGGVAEKLAIAGGLVSTPVIGWSLYTLKTTGCGLPPGPGGSIGALEGVSYLVVAAIVGWSLYTKTKTGSGLPSGPFGLLGAVEGLSYLCLLAIIAVFGLQFLEKGSIPGPLPSDQCFG